jgi:hypothetical protein
MNEKSLTASSGEAVVAAKALDLVAELGKMVGNRVFDAAVGQALPMLGSYARVGNRDHKPGSNFYPEVGQVSCASKSRFSGRRLCVDISAPNRSYPIYILLYIHSGYIDGWKYVSPQRKILSTQNKTAR